MTDEYILIVVDHKLRRIEAVDVFADVDQNRLYVPWDIYKHHRTDGKEYAVGYEAAFGPPGFGLIAAYIRLDDKKYAACKNKYL